VARWFRGSLSVADPFGCRCLTSYSNAPFPLPPRRTGRADLPHPALRRASLAGTRCATSAPSPAGTAPSATSEPVMGLLDLTANPQALELLPLRARSQVPSLHGRYPASAVIRTCPTPHTAGPVPRGRPVGSNTHRLGSPVFASISLYRHAVAYTPVGPQVGSSRSPETCDSGLPRGVAGSAPTFGFSRPPWRSRLLRPACSRNR